MDRSPLFVGLTMPVTFMGLPMAYVVVLLLMVLGGFIATLSYIYFMVSALIGYSLLRMIAKYDLRLIDVILVVLHKTPVRSSQLKGKGVTHRA